MIILQTWRSRRGTYDETADFTFQGRAVETPCTTGFLECCSYATFLEIIHYIHYFFSV